MLLRGVRFHWRKFFLALAIIFYLFTMPFWLGVIFKRGDTTDSQYSNLFYKRPSLRLEQKVNDSSNEETFAFVYKGRTLHVKEILTASGMSSLKERMSAPNIVSTKRILSDSDFQAENFGGCPDWKCEVTKDYNNADAFINSFPTSPNFTGYVLFSTQESPANFGVSSNEKVGFNMSIGFRHDSPVASPYGYTVLLGEKSWRELDQVVDKDLINGKSKGAAWFVSHCVTQSKRENLVEKLKKHIDVDVYGSCGDNECPKQDKCENMINTHYHFYLALENSICVDYITEKLWNQGYGYTVIPIVLKRKLIEPYTPPNSFIAFDDYKSAKEMATHLKQLMDNKMEYMKYFEWRQKYEVIFLDGLKHDELEKPWGLCQLCRLLHLNPRPHYSIESISKYWAESCDEDGRLANKLLG